MVNRYETLFILTPVLSEDQAKETVKHYEKVLKDMKGKMIHQESWGMKKLAYPIQKKSTGFYHLMEFDAEGESIDKVEKLYRRDERVLRFLTTKMDKHAAAYAVKRRTQKKKAVEEPTAEKSKT